MSLIAVIAYVAVAFLAAAAGWTTMRRAMPQSQVISWFCCAAFFLILAFVRWMDLEELARETARGWIIAEHAYNNRQSFQAPLAALIVVIGALSGWLAVHRVITAPSRPQFLVRLTHLAIIGFVGLLVLRIVSLHMIDQWLYAGPLRLNWLLDGLLTATVAAAAIACIVGKRTTSRRTHRPSD